MIIACIVAHDNRMYEHANYTNHLYVNVSICLIYALLYTTIECVDTLTIQTIYMINVSTYFVCIVIHDNRMCEHAYCTNHLYA